jgi:hypothetical protein
MKNLNEPYKDVPSEMPPEPQVIPMGGLRSKGTGDSPLISKPEIEELRARWTLAQSTFVDNPRKAVEDANALVLAAMKQIEEWFKNQRSQIEKQLSKGNVPSTEDLRIALQQYRTVFERLLSL